MRTVIYARVSTTEQAQKDKASIPAQVRAAREVAKQRGWLLVRDPYIDAGISGQKFKERQALQTMLQEAEAGRFDLLIIYDNDRLSRKGSIGAQVYDRLDKAGVQVYSINQPIEPCAPKKYDPQENDTVLINRTIGGLSSELYINLLRRRFQMGLKQRVQNGHMPSSVPYGYQIDYQRRSDGQLEKVRIPHPEQAPFVRRLFEEYRRGQSFLALARKLNEEGVPSQKGGVWCSPTIRSILMNSVYCGEVVLGRSRTRNGKRIQQDPSEWLRAPGKHPPLISRELFEEVQKIRQSRARHGRAVGSPNLLSGLIKCSYCGWSMIRDGHGYFVCGQYHQSGQCQRNGKNRNPKLEELVLGQIQQLQREPQLLEKLRQQRKQSHHRNLERELVAHRQELEKLPQRQQRLMVAYERKVVTLEELEERKGGLAEEEHRLNQVIRQLEEQIASHQQRQKVLDSAQEALQTFDQHFEDLPLPMQKQLLRNLIEKIIIRQKEVRIDFLLS